MVNIKSRESDLKKFPGHQEKYKNIHGWNIKHEGDQIIRDTPIDEFVKSHWKF